MMGGLEGRSPQSKAALRGDCESVSVSEVLEAERLAVHFCSFLCGHRDAGSRHVACMQTHVLQG